MLMYLVAFLAGLAALVWEILWMHHTVLVIGVSAQAAAIVLSVMMTGLAFGSWIAGFFLKDSSNIKTLWFLALLECGIGLSGLWMPSGFRFVEQLDHWAFHSLPYWVFMFECLGVVGVIGVPALLMGATIPVYARLAGGLNISLTKMYVANLAGAAAGILAASFILIPYGGIARTGIAAMGLNLLAASFVLGIRNTGNKAGQESQSMDTAIEPLPWNRAVMVVFCTGFVTFALEVLWFRSLRSALQATTESFAIVLFVTLITLALGGAISEHLRKSNRLPISVVLALASFLVFETTPLIERFDQIAIYLSGSYEMFMLKRLLFVFVILGPPMTSVGIALPWILEMFRPTSRVPVLYAVNTLGAVLGSLAAAWLLLPAVGFVKGTWFVGGVLLVISFMLASKKHRTICLALGIAGFAIAVLFKTDVGKTRVQGVAFNDYSVLAFREGVDVNTAVVESSDGTRQLYIDGYSASSEDRGAHYMEWMGRLPMLLHPSPRHALVICFGTGQTADGVRKEDPQRLDIVDVNPAVFDFAHLFTSNRDVLKDARVHRYVMDGRAFLRRTDKSYDVVTLEPMPPTFAGSNALYSVEFYRLVHERLTPNGVAAQWLPFHLVDPEQSAAIVASFRQVFDNAVLWIDPVSLTGIVLGSKSGRDLQWYGLENPGVARGLEPEVIRGNAFARSVVERFSRAAPVITDDNQLLSYGYGRMKWWATDGKEKDLALKRLIRLAGEP